MNYQHYTTTPSNPLLNEDLNSLYKVYVGFEKDRNNSVTSIEIIDGYLRANESMSLRNLSITGQGVCYVEVEINSGNSLNTFLKVNHNMNHFDSLIVKIFRKGKCVGYQWIDKNGNILQPAQKPAQPAQKQSIPQ